MTDPTEIARVAAGLTRAQRGADSPARQIITVRLRLKDKHAADLNRQARAVNFVWNYCGDIQRKAMGYRRKWPSAFDLQKLTAGSSKELGLHGHTIQRVCRAFELSRRKTPTPRWRGAKSLGWVPFNTGQVSFDGASFKFNGKRYTTMHVRPILASGMRFAAGSFNADSKGRWFLNLPVEVACDKREDGPAVGVDLGLKALASLSDGTSIALPKFYRDSELALATAQRAGKAKRARAIHAKVANRRKDFHHKASKALCEKYRLIVVGDVSSSKLAKTKMAKSVYDAGWSGFKTMLRYKAIMHGRKYIEVNEAYSTQTCSLCGSLPASRPKGIAELGIRGWNCSDCGAVHDRDTNAALNILRVGLDTLAEGVLRASSMRKESSQHILREKDNPHD